MLQKVHLPPVVATTPFSKLALPLMVIDDKTWQIKALPIIDRI